jgi:four helix bundle protein
MHNYQELKVWQKAVELAQLTYKVTAGFPNDERFGLTSQIRRSAVSVASNIAEGAGRNTNKDFQNFISIAAGSAFELETQLIIALKVNFLANDDCETLRNELEQIKKMLFSLRRKLHQTS